MPSLNSFTVPKLCRRVIDVDRVVDILHNQVLKSLVLDHTDPRTCPSTGAKCCTYMQWFAHADRAVYHPHVRCTNISAGKHRDLMRFRLGCADIAVNAGRFVVNKKPRAERICPCCDSGQAEDEKHVVLECPAYDCIRSRAEFAALFDDDQVIDMRSIFCDPQHQSVVADFIRAISLERKKLVAVL